MNLTPHWKNPWNDDVVYVPIEELVKCAAGIGESCKDKNGSSFIMTEEIMLKHWRQGKDKLDAYILPCTSGYHCIGIRYGNNGNEYLSPMGNKDKVEALLQKYRKVINLKSKNTGAERSIVVLGEDEYEWFGSPVDNKEAPSVYWLKSIWKQI